MTAHTRGVRTVLLAVASVLILASCSGPGPDSRPGSGVGGTTAAPELPPSSAVASPTPTLVPVTPTPSPPAMAALAPEVQAELDRQLVSTAKANDLPGFTELIEAGGNVNARDSIQDSAFLYAGAEGFNEILEVTLAHGADVSSVNRYGGTALIPASEHGHVETIRILIAAGVPVNHVNDLGWTALQEAVLLNNGGPRQQDVIRQLLAAGADPDIRDPQGRTVLENAQWLGFGEIVAIIEQHEQHP